MNQSREIIDIIADAVKAVSGVVLVQNTDYKGVTGEPENVDVDYIFGSAAYFKDTLDEKSRMKEVVKFPAIVLFSPFTEHRNTPDYYSKAKVHMLIACSTKQEWSNEQRKVYSFENVLRPIYRSLLDVLAADERLDFGYDRQIHHDYSENYSYGKYGAYVDHTGDMVSEPIDAIDIRELELKVKFNTCR